MKLLHVVPSYYPAVRYGGPIWSVHALCKALSHRGHEVHVVTTDVDGPGNLDVPLCRPVELDGVHVTYHPVRRLRRLTWAPSLGKDVRARLPHIDFVHLHSVFQWPTFAAARAAECLGVPWCVAPRGALVRSLVRQKSRLLKTLWLTLIEWRTLERAAFIHATSALEASDVRAFGHPLIRVDVIPNGVDVPVDTDLAQWKTRPRPRGIPVDAPLLAFLGRISWKKGLDRLVLALAQMPGVHLAVAGNDEERLTPRLLQLAQRAGASGRVHFLGAIHGDAKDALLAGADMLVLPSYHENFGNVVLEALACDTAVAVTAEVGAAAMIDKARAGIIVPAEPVAMAAAIQSALLAPAELAAMAARGRALVQAAFSWDAIGAQMEAAYRSAIDETKRHRGRM